MKAEEKTAAFMFFSVVMQFVYSLGEQNKQKKSKKKKKKKKNRIRGWGGQKQRNRRAKFSLKLTTY